MNSAIQKTTGNIQQMGRELSMAVTLPIAALGAAAIKSAAQLESMEASFVSLTGGAQQAADMMKNLNEFAANTPFQIENIAKAARQLLAAGTPVEKVNEQLQFLGDIAATSGSSVEEIAAIFAKVNAKGKVELENLNQLAERGIPIFRELSEATGLPADALGAGAVSVEQFNSVLKSFAQEGGFAAGAMARLSQTAEGKFSTAVDNLKLAGASMAESLLPVIGKLLDGFTSLMQDVASMSDGMKVFTLTIAGVAAAIGPVLVVIPNVVKGFQMMRAAALALNTAIAANPFVAAAAALALVGVAASDYISFTDPATAAANRFNDAVGQAEVEAAKQTAAVERLSAAVMDETKSEEKRLKALQELQRISPEHFGNLDLERAKMGELATAVDAYRESVLQAAKARVFTKQLDEAIERQEKLKQQLAEGPSLMDRFMGALGGPAGGIAAMTQRVGTEMAETSQLITKLTEELDAIGPTTTTATNDASTGIQNFAAATTQTAAVAAETKKELTDLEYALQQIATLSDDPLSIDLQVRRQEQVMSGGMNLQEIDDSWMDTADEDVDYDAMSEQVNAFYDNMDARLQNTKAMTEELTSSMGTFIGSMIKGGPEAGNALKQFGRSAVRTLFNVVKAAAVASASQSAAATGPGAIAALPIMIGGALSLVEGLLGAIAFADGGIVSGPTLGLVGEYSGARNNPEVIAPLDKLRSMIAETGGGAQEVTVTGRISGNDIELISERGRNNLRRSR